MKWLLALALAVPLLDARGEEPAKGWAIVRKDGTVTWLLEPPTVKGASYVGKLAPGGQLVTFRADEVDEARTRAANTHPTPTAVPSNVPFQKPPTATPVPKKKLKVPRPKAEAALGELSGPSAAAGRQPPPPAPGTREAMPEAAELEVPEFEPTDRDGHGEGWWRPRAERARRRLAHAEADLRSAERAADHWDSNPEVWGTEYWAMELSRLRARVERSRMELAEEQRRWAELVEDARKAGAYPGWLR